MSTELLPGDNERVSNLPSYNGNDNFLTFHIIQGAQASYPQFKLGHRIRPQPLDCTSECRRLMHKSRCNSRLQDSLLANRQREKVLFSVSRDRDPEGHGQSRFVHSLTQKTQ
jgi:hypothetical protein